MEKTVRLKPAEPLELSLFCHQFAMVLKSGMTPVEGLPLIADEVLDTSLKGALQHAGEALSHGESMYEAFSASGVFPSYMLATVRLGEMTGKLEAVLESLSLYYEKEDALGKKLRSALVYPSLLLVLMTAVIVLLVAKILPMFAKILDSLGASLPTATKVLMTVGAFFAHFGVLLLVFLAVLTIVLYFVFRTEAGKMRLDTFLLSVPFYGKVLVKVSAAHFSNGIALVLQSGMELTEGLGIVKGLMKNRAMKERLDEVENKVSKGSDLGSALEAVALFPPLFTHMIRIGQKTGELDGMMAKVSTVYETEVETSLQHLANAIEPVLVIILSVVVGVILLAVMLPLIQILGTIG